MTQIDCLGCEQGDEHRHLEAEDGPRETCCAHSCAPTVVATLSDGRTISIGRTDYPTEHQILVGETIHHYRHGTIAQAERDARALASSLEADRRWFAAQAAK